MDTGGWPRAIERWYPIDGQTTHCLVWHEEDTMKVDPILQECCVFISYLGVDGEINWAGTAFLMGVEEMAATGSRWFRYLVTAKHVLLGIEKDAPGADPIIRFNTRDGGLGKIAIPIDCWASHQEDVSVDMAIAPLPDGLGDMNQTSVAAELVLTAKKIAEHEVGVGDQVVLAALFPKHPGQSKNLAIVRQGTIALMPEEKVNVKDFGEIEAYLVEVISIGGHSGSPVFVHLYPGRKTSKGALFVLGRPEYLLLGLVHGHYSHEDAETGFAASESVAGSNEGIGIIVPAEKALEILAQDSFVLRRQEVVAEINSRALPEAD